MLASKKMKIASLMAGLGMMLVTASAQAVPIQLTLLEGTNPSTNVFETNASGHISLGLVLDVTAFYNETTSAPLNSLLGFDMGIASSTGGLALEGITLSTGLGGFMEYAPGQFVNTNLNNPAVIGSNDFLLATLDIAKTAAGTLDLDILGTLWLANEPLSLDFLLDGLSLTGSIATAPVPEPGTWLLMGTGLALLIGLKRRKLLNGPTPV